jgi:hypothetical protein
MIVLVFAKVPELVISNVIGSLLATGMKENFEFVFKVSFEKEYIKFNNPVNLSLDNFKFII